MTKIETPEERLDRLKRANEKAQQEAYDSAFDMGVLAGIQAAVVSLMERDLNDAAAIVLSTPHPTRAEVMAPDTSDIPEATEEWFAKAKLKEPAR